MVYEGYKYYINQIKILCKEKVLKTYDNKIEKIKKKDLDSLKKALSSKEEFIKRYRNFHNLWLDKDLFKSIKLKFENEKRSIINNPRCKNKKKLIKDLEEREREITKDFKNLIKAKWYTK